jgi:hypothetical protein
MLSDVEVERLARIERNKAKLVELGVAQAVTQVLAGTENGRASEKDPWDHHHHHSHLSRALNQHPTLMQMAPYWA